MSFGEDPQVGVENAQTTELPRVGPVRADRTVPTTAELIAGVGTTPVYDGVLLGGTTAAPAEDPAAVVAEQLSDWWQDESTRDMLAVVPKAIEYGSSDLKAMGAQLVALHPGVDGMDAGEREKVGQEMAIAFYLLGKVTRLFGAYERGGQPSDDTIHDVTVYSMMFRRVRSEGGWPR